MTELLEYLESFNRKERFILLAEAIGPPGIRLGKGFRDRVGAAFGLEIPADALVAMDYHLDWLRASLLSLHADTTEPMSNAGGLIRGNQEDIDLLVAFSDGSLTRLLLLEAKAATGWSNRQLQSKADRLRAIFGDHGDAFSEAVPHFALLSPRRPGRLDTVKWPDWMAQDEEPPIWLELPMPRNRRRVTRTDEQGRPSAAGSHFTVTRSST